MKHAIFFLLVLLSNQIHAQKINDTSKLLVVYDTKMNVGHNNSKLINYVLLIGDDFTYSSAESKLDKFSNYEVDRTKLESNMSYIEDSFYFKDNVYYALGEYIGNKLAYKETLKNNWTLHDNFKIINTIKCQKATMTKYGRKWTAYFSLEHTLPYGPYKFNGLPGLVIEIYDERNDYQFHLKEINKTNYNISFNLSNYKFIDKKKFFQTAYNLKYTLAAYPPFEDAEFKKEVYKRVENRKKSENNPIELKID